jgi:hypothetical protein
MNGAVVLLLGLVVAVGGLVLTIWYQAARRRTLSTWAARNGWTYADSDDSLVTLSRRDPFGEGHHRCTAEVLRGRFSGRDVVSFVYRWRTGSGKDEQRHAAHVVAVALPAYLPIVEVVPEGLGARLAAAFGGQDLRFESEEFNRAFRVQAYDERTAYAIVHPRLMERLLEPDGRLVAWRTDGTWILSWHTGATDLDTLASRLSVLGSVVSAIPRHVWQDHGYDPLAEPAR